MAKKILIIEDSATDAAVIKGLLEEEGFKVDVATTGEEGIRKANEVKPDLIVLDLILPDLGGFEVCTRIKKEVSLSGAIIVILSVKDDLEDVMKAFSIGADDYVVKPPEPTILVRKIKLYLGLR